MYGFSSCCLNDSFKAAQRESDSVSFKKRITSPGSMQDTGCLGLVHWDDPEGWYGEGGGRGHRVGDAVQPSHPLLSPSPPAPNPDSMQDTRCLGLVHWDDPEGWYGEGGGRGFHPGKNTGVGFHSLLQGIFPTQESNQGLLHCSRILSQLSYQGIPLAPPGKPQTPSRE